MTFQTDFPVAIIIFPLAVSNCLFSLKCLLPFVDVAAYFLNDCNSEWGEVESKYSAELFFPNSPG